MVAYVGLYQIANMQQSNNSLFEAGLAVALVVLATLATALGQPQQCDFTSESLPQDGDHYVYPNVTCAGTGLNIVLVHNYLESDLERSRIQLFYECADELGNVTSGAVPLSRNFHLDDYLYTVPLPSSFVGPGTTCRVYGCYEDNFQDVFQYHFPIQNRTCNYGEIPTATPTTTLPATLKPSSPALDPFPSSSVTDPLFSGIATIISLSTVSRTTRWSAIIASPTATVEAAHTMAPSHLTPVHNDLRGNDDLILALTLALIIVIVVGSAIVIALAAALIRAHHVQRRKLIFLRYYNYSEPIDPYFSPVDVNAKLKPAVSVLSVFDELALYQSSGGDDFLATNAMSENKSTASFDDEGENSSEQETESAHQETEGAHQETESAHQETESAHQETESAHQEEAKVLIEEPTEVYSNEDQFPNKPSVHNGYVLNSCITVDGRSPQLDPPLDGRSPQLDLPLDDRSPQLDPPLDDRSPQLDPPLDGRSPQLNPPLDDRSPQLDPPLDSRSPQLDPPLVSNGYVLEKHAGVQTADRFVRHEDTTINVPTTLNWNRTEQFRLRLLSSTSSGYVTEADLSTPLNYSRHQLSISSAEMGVVPLKPLLPQKYSTLENGYTVLESQRCVVFKTLSQEEDSNSAVYSLTSDSDCEGVESDCVGVENDCEGVESDCEGVESDCVGVESDCESVKAKPHTDNVAKCSLSLNPLHFEPVDDRISEQTSPSYVNTSASDQLQHVPQSIDTSPLRCF